MTRDDAWKFANHWVEAWNSHALDLIRGIDFPIIAGVLTRVHAGVGPLRFSSPPAELHHLSKCNRIEATMFNALDGPLSLFNPAPEVAPQLRSIRGLTLGVNRSHELVERRGEQQ